MFCLSVSLSRGPPLDFYSFDESARTLVLTHTQAKAVKNQVLFLASNQEEKYEKKRDLGGPFPTIFIFVLATYTKLLVAAFQKCIGLKLKVLPK